MRQVLFLGAFISILQIQGIASVSPEAFSQRREKLMAQPRRWCSHPKKHTGIYA